MNVHDEKNLREPLTQTRISMSGPELEDPNLKQPQKAQKIRKFQFTVFFEFIWYFLVSSILGPLGYLLILRNQKNGKVLSRNLHVFGRSDEWIRTIYWLMKVFCYISTFAFSPSDNAKFKSFSQFWLLIYTEISLIVLYAAFYSSYNDEEIEKLKTEDDYDKGGDIFDRLMEMIKDGHNKVSDKKALVAAFPEIDESNFFFVFPKSYENKIPGALEPEDMDKAAPDFKKTGIVKGFVVRAEKLASYAVEVIGYRRFELKTVFLKFVSRLLVFIRVTLPVIMNIYAILSKMDPFNTKHIARFVFYLFQQGFYSYLIYRFVTVYDVIFLGIFLYRKKYNMLNWLGEIISLKTRSVLGREDFRLCCYVPQNAQSWLNVRRILSSMNSQVFVVVDTNLSFVLIYSFLFLAFIFLETLDLLMGLFRPVLDFLEAYPALLILLALTVLIVIVVLIADVVLGILINLLFTTERGEWLLHKSVAGHIETKAEMYLDSEYLKKPQNRHDTHSKKLEELKELLGEDQIKDKIHVYLRKLRNSFLLVVDGITAEEEVNPHTLFGVPTDITSVVAISTIASALGVTTISQVFDIIERKG